MTALTAIGLISAWFLGCGVFVGSMLGPCIAWVIGGGGVVVMMTRGLDPTPDQLRALLTATLSTRLGPELVASAADDIVFVLSSSGLAVARRRFTALDQPRLP